MKNIEYKIGGIELQINPGDAGRSRRTIEPHCFIGVASEEERDVSFYAANVAYHSDVAKRYRLNGAWIVGGGIFVVGEKNLFVLNYSRDYKKVHPNALKIFAGLLKGELEKSGLEIDSVKIDDVPMGINDYWTQIYDER